MYINTKEGDYLEQKNEEYAGLAIASLWRAVELSASRRQSVQGRTVLGAAYRARKDPISLERAAAQYELVLHHVPAHRPAMTGLAAVLRDQGELSHARRLYEQVLAVAPHDAHALAGLAGVLHDAGDEAGAAALSAKWEAISGAAPVAPQALTWLDTPWLGLGITTETPSLTCSRQSSAPLLRTRAFRTCACS